MHFFVPIVGIHYRLCSLTEGKEWFVSFYVINPATGKLRRIRIKINRIKNKVERRHHAKMMMAAINQRLASGWNPLIEESAPNAYIKMFDTFDAFLKAKARNTEEETMRSYTSFIRVFREWLTKQGFTKDSYCQMVSKQVAGAFMDELETRVSVITYNNYLTFMHILFGWMMKKGYSSEDPFEDISRKSRKKAVKRRRLMTDAELGRLFSFLSGGNKEYLAMCLICYCCLVRPKEIAMLKCSDIDLRSQLLHVDESVAKNDNDSYRTIPDGLIPLLAGLDLSHPEWYLFGDHKGDDFSAGPKKMRSRKISAWWSRKVRPACGFNEELEFYSLKDTGITNMLSEGVAINFVQQQADHSNVAITSIYIGKKNGANEELRNIDIIPMGAGA